MDIDEDDDFYAPEEPAEPSTQQRQPEEAPQAQAPKQQEGDLEEGEEEDDEDDSDIDIITERKDGTKAAPPSQSRYNEIRNIPQRGTTSDASAKPAVVKKETTSKPVSGADLPGIATSKIDIDAKPIYEPAGKPITQVDIDEDLGENDKPWRRPGTDITDYFNYGFDEFTWALYASKQESLRAEYNQDKIAANNKKMFEDLNMMMAMGGMPGMPGMPAAGGSALPPMPGMEGIPPEMQAMMQQMMASGMDPSQMDPAAMFAGMQGNQAAAGGAAGGANQGQGFGGQGGFGQGQNQQMGFGYDQNMMAGGDTRNRGGNFGRGRGGRRNW
ncbi:hypothetical protein B7463_g3464, partial [Scytalidium lignicola]